MSRYIALISLIVTIATIAVGCGNDSPPQRIAESGVALQGDFSGSGPGTLLAANSLVLIDRRLRAITSVAGRVEYTSTSGVNNTETRVTGTVFAPKGPAPDGGWPVIAIGHASTGIAEDCAPSLSPSLSELAPVVTLLVEAGYVVTIADYQGLGNGQTYHPYLEPITVGYNVIDSIRAARKLVPEASDRWVAVGVSQGGQAAWAANELASTYGKGLTLLGSVSLAPPLNLTYLADAAAAGKLTKEEAAAYPSILASLKNEFADFNLDDYRRGIVAQNWDLLLRCDVSTSDARKKVLDQTTADDLQPKSQAATDALRDHLLMMSLPQRVTTAPMLVIYGGKDAYVPADSTDLALAEACRMGDTIDISKQPDKGHNDIDIRMALTWISDRFSGAPVTDSCTAPPPPPV